MLIYLGMLDGSHPLPGSLSALRIIVWKFALIAMVRVDTDGAKYNSADVWRSALRRFESRVRRYDIYVDRLALRRDSKGDPPQQLVRHNDVLYPLPGYEGSGQPVPRRHLTQALTDCASL